MSIRVLIVEDDADLRDALCDYLGGVGMDVRGIESAKALDQRLAQLPADVVVCDVNLPGESGFSVAGRLRRASKAGIVMLTARTKHEDRIMGLSLGADHYLVKPVDLHELEVVIRNLSQRVSGDANDALEAAQADGADIWVFDLSHWTLTAPGGVTVQLSLLEHRILGLMMSRAGVVATRDELLAVLERRNVGSLGRNLDMIMSRMRKKIERVCGEKLPVVSARSHGYVFTGQGRVVG